MKIPKRFKLLGHTVEVKDEPAGHYEKGRHGACNFEAKWIKITPRSDSHPVTQSSVEHTFIHELVHMCIYHTEQHQLNDNEGFIDSLAGLIHQALTTAEYE